MNEQKIDEDIKNIGYSMIGDYQILGVIGKEGHSTLYLAQQETPVLRKLVVRLMKPDIDHKEIIASFKSIKQTSAFLNHENIGKVLDTGITDQGLPYFVSEYIPGLPITQHCDNYRMTIPQRLELFETVCSAVQHAHFKGIVHCRLKPGAIRVTLQEGKTLPRIVDFGIAKALADQDLIEKTLHTGQDGPLEIPFYLAPEQAALSGMGIDTRTDVYSLGVILYELLVGAAPFDERELQNQGFMEILRRIQEEVPPAPAARLEALGERADSIARKRGTNFAALKKELQGDLARIIKKALEKEVSRRYHSVSELIADIQGYLNQEPVKAHPPSFTYGIHKYIQRNRFKSLSIISLIVLVLVFFLWNVTARLKTEAEKKRAFQLRQTSNYNFAAALKDKALVFANKNQWQMARLFAIHSMLYQAKAEKYFPLGDIPLPFEFQNWIIKYSLPGFSPLLSLSSDGRSLASADKEGNITIWEISSGKVVTHLKGKGKHINSLSFSPDGQYLAASEKKRVRIWDIPNKSCKTGFTVPEGDEKNILAVLFSADGKYLAVSSLEVVDILDTARETITASLSANGNQFTSHVFSPAGRYLALGLREGAIQLKDMTNFVQGKTLPGNGQPVSALCFSPEGKYLAAGGGSSVKIWDPAGGEITGNLAGPAESIQSLCFSPDEKYLVSGNIDGTIHIWELTSGKETAALSTGNRAVVKVDFTPDGRYLVSGSTDRIIRVWEMFKEKKIPSLQGNSGYGKLVDWSPHSPYLAAADDNTVRIWNIGENEIVTLKGIHNPIEAIRFSPGGKHLATAGDDQVKLWETASGKQTMTLNQDLKGINSIDFTSTGKYLVGSGDKAVRIWETASGKVIATFHGDPTAKGPVRFSPAGNYLAEGDSQGIIKLRDLANLEITTTLSGHDGAITSLSISPDGKFLASSAARDKIVKIWEIDSSPRAIDLKGHRSVVQAVSFSPDGKFLASGSISGIIKIWAVSRHEEIATLTSGRQPITDLDFSPDSSFLVSGFGNSFKIWDFHYFVDYLYPDLDYPYSAEDLLQLLKRVEQETGYTLAGITPLPPANAYTFYNQGETYLENKEYNKAVAAFHKSIELNPNSSSTWYGLGTAYRYQKKLAEAVAALQEAVKLNPDADKTWYQLGLAFRQKREYDRAVEAFRKSLELKTDSARTWRELGNTYGFQEEYDKAVAAFQKAVEIRPRYAAAWFDLGRTYERKEEYDEAVTAFQQALEISPEDASTWNNLGITLNKKGEYNRSLEAFDKATAINPAFAAAWNNMAITYRYIGDFEKAVKFHQQALDIDPLFDLAWDALGSTYNAKKDYDKAVAAYRRAVRLNPEFWSAWANLGFIYIKKEDYNKAIDAFEHTTRINPGFFAAWSNLGDLYAQKEEYNSSIDAYQRAVEIEEDNHTVWNNLGKSYFRKGDYRQAMKQFEQAVKVNPRNFSAQFNIALTYLMQKEFENAYNAYSQVMDQLSPDIKFVEAAIKDIDRLIQDRPDSNFALLIRRFLHNKAGEKDKAREDLDRFIKFIKENKGK